MFVLLAVDIGGVSGLPDGLRLYFITLQGVAGLDLLHLLLHESWGRLPAATI